MSELSSVASELHVALDVRRGAPGLGMKGTHEDTRYLQDIAGVTIKKLVQTLRPLRSVVIAISDQTIPADPTPGPDARTILDQLPAITLGHETCESQVRALGLLLIFAGTSRALVPAVLIAAAGTVIAAVSDPSKSTREGMAQNTASSATVFGCAVAGCLSVVAGYVAGVDFARGEHTVFGSGGTKISGE